ncbi:heat shock protein DnaJ-like [Gloeomargarita lithophora Alchichica-D10]|uniref:Heat shock protein DnaJ-like n=1 Tax=Gloeomargarita lithophora Alchichica-D10 TaxID=1188229 RepID=A0A1J0AF68_9CYAN|nr:DnaJ domain-containing protein [Gloeomargarita lithophora]APB34547.1 heat shock protein DnaJ-like [Gloeomargarita lithophora Alchichica-D10]
MADPKLVQSYQCLGLPLGAPLEEVKATYRRLARQHHPDLNPGNQASHERFIALNQAYNYLLEQFAADVRIADPVTPQVRVEVKTQPSPPNPTLTPEEQQFKHKFHVQWRTLLEQGRFPRAVALLDALAERLSQDRDIPTWQAQTYQRWGSDLINQGQWDKARNYLKKALRLDPHNRQLWEEVNREFIRLDQRINKY